MAKRPVFVPNPSGTRLVTEVPVEFHWHPGMAASQKKKKRCRIACGGEQPSRTCQYPRDIEQVRAQGRHPAQRIPSAPDERTGMRPPWNAGSREARFSKAADPLPISISSPRAKQNVTLDCVKAGDLVGFRFEGRDFPLSPATAFYDWIYIRALAPHSDWAQKLGRFDAFSDIEFNPTKSVNCQARSCATFVALCHRREVQAAANDFDHYKTLMGVAI